MSLRLAHWMPIDGKVAIMSLLSIIILAIPFVHRSPTKLCGCCLYGKSLVTQDTMANAVPV